ncbi:bifunctional UDP-sugar hydrolase/5'-nucleotidase [Ammoniphilus sp. 3BR4]|uniref:bifunctional metallophosphatase/5'-nucleotidase n=1 Tax=Ammoniphilus sp. 3BR4 TaxID=3158265 RepID=UPI0034659948
MEKFWRVSAGFILLIHTIGCGMNNRPQENYQVEQTPLQYHSSIQEQGGKDPVGINPNTGGKESGLSEEYHGHIQDRPISPRADIQSEESFQSLAAQKGYKSIQLLGINDLHGQLNVTRRVNGKPAGRVDYLAAYLKQREAKNKNTLLVHAGDMIGASPPVSALLQDEPTMEILNQLDFDIGTVGNHEFDEGVRELLRLIRGGTHQNTGYFAGSSYPWVVANVFDKKTGKSLPPHKVITVDGMPIGFIGVCLSNTPNIVVESAVAGLRFTDEVQAINDSVAKLKKQGVRAIVVLAHNPGSSSINGKNPSGELVRIAKNIDDEVDIIFGGHNHAYMNAVVDNKLIVQSYSYGTAFSDVDLWIDPKTKDIVQKKAQIVITFQEGIQPDPKIRSMVTKYEKKVAASVNRVIGYTTSNITSIKSEEGESALGNLIADAQRAAMKTDFSFMNAGGIRADIGRGMINWGELYTVLPFNNILVKMDLTGKQIRDLLNQQWRDTGSNMLQISGLKYTWDANRPIGDKLVNVYLKDGSEIDASKTYSVTVNNFLAEGGDNFTIFRQGKNRETGIVDLDALVNYVQKLPKPFTYQIEGRIRKLFY